MRITPLKQNQQGMGHVVMVVTALVVVGVIGFVGWKVAGSTKKASTVTTAATTNTEKIAAASGCEAAYHDANLCKFSTHAAIDKTAYKANLTTTGTDGKVTTLTLQADGKGNTALTGDGLNTVQLDGTSYIQTEGVWYKYPASSTKSAAADPTANMNLVLGAGITYKPLGKEACGSRTCFKYQVSEAATPDTTQLVWFDTSDYLLRQWRATDKTNGTTQMTLDYSSVKITAPSPAQDFSVLGQ